jgi:hypothetical protein
VLDDVSMAGWAMRFGNSGRHDGLLDDGTRGEKKGKTIRNSLCKIDPFQGGIKKSVTLCGMHTRNHLMQA